MISIIFSSCKKENTTQDLDKQNSMAFTHIDVVVKNERLSFATGNDLSALLSMGETGSEKFLSRVVDKEGFVSSLAYDKIRSQAQNKGISKLMSIGSTTESFDESEPLDFLVPDPIIASVLNENMELEVQGLVYKVTPFGTFVTIEEEYQVLVDVLENEGNQTQDMETHVFYSNPIGEDTYEIATNVYLYDTYMNANSERQAIELMPAPEDGGGSNGGGGGGTGAPSTNTAIQNGDYSSLPLINFDRHTVVGQWLDSMFGTKEVYKAEYSSDNRVKVALYNTNYIFTKSLGIKVSMQKKNWIGWSGTRAQEMRLGWEGISFTASDNTTPVNPWQPLKQSFPYTGNPEWDRTIPPFAKPDAIYREIDLLGFPVNLNVSQSFQQGVKLLFDYAKSKNISIPAKNQMTNLIVWKTPSRTQSVIIAGPGEVVDYDTEWLQVNFARSTDIIVGFPTSTSRSELLKALIKTLTASQSATSIKLQGASIYGVAKYDYKWLGARIDKKD